MSVDCNGFFLTVIGLADLRPFGPGIVLCSLVRSLGHHLDLGHRLGSVTDGSSHTVITGITTADDDHVLTLGLHIFFIFKVRIQQALGIGFQKIHREIDSPGISAWRIDVSGIGSTTGQYDTVKIM